MTKTPEVAGMAAREVGWDPDVSIVCIFVTSFMKSMLSVEHIS